MDLVEAFSGRAPVVVTGAGISVASGIPTFRGTDPDAVWAKDTTELGTVRYFRRDPAGSWRWYLARFDGVRAAAPNPAHHAITAIEAAVVARGAPFLCVTQNIDGLHVRAGTTGLVEIHGAARKIRCSRNNCPNGAPSGFLAWDDAMFTAFRADPRRETVPRCPRCDAPLRAHVLWFDEMYTDHADYQFHRALGAFGAASALVFVGTSFSVGITALAVEAAGRARIPVFVIDPGGPPRDAVELAAVGAIVIREPAEVVLPRVAAALGPPLDRSGLPG
ncbi:MAG: Sir2 family NAD-dependent protein deacetylase [Myxococcota bacterium]